MISGGVNCCCTVSYNSKSCCALWWGVNVLFSAWQVTSHPAESVLFAINELASETVRMAGGASQQRAEVVSVESTKV